MVFDGGWLCHGSSMHLLETVGARALAAVLGGEPKVMHDSHPSQGTPGGAAPNTAASARPN